MPRRTASKGDLGRSNEPPVLILTSLAAGPKHGYALTKDIEEFAGVNLGPGTLYGAIARLEERGFIAPEPAGDDERRRPYRITGDGRVALESAVRQMRTLAEVGATRCRDCRDGAGRWCARVTIQNYEQLLRWYPPQWRARYGGEMTALLEDTYSTASDVPLVQRVGLVRSGLAERARSAGLVGPSQDPDVRLRGGSLLVLCGWAFFIVAGAMFVKDADRWSVSRSHAVHWVAAAGFNVVGVTIVIGCLAVLLSALLVLPAFVRFLRAGRWNEVARPVVVAVVSVAVSAMLFVILVAWAHSLTGQGRNGGSPIYGWFFVLVSLVFFAAVGCGTTAAVSVARRVELTRPTLRTLSVMAIGLVGVMALTLISLVAWWASEAVHAPGFLAQTIGNGVPFTSSVVPPTLLASGLLMALGLALGVAGLVRIVGALGPERGAPPLDRPSGQNGRRDVGRPVFAASHLTGSFVLRSGRKADHYFDKYRFESDPALLAEIVAALVPLVPPGVEGVAGLELGGVPLATMLSSVTSLPAYFVRKAPKKYGTEKICEGGDVEGRHLVIIEDVVTTGGQMVLSAQDLRAEGAVVKHALCVIDREGGGADVVGAEGIELRALFTMRDLEQFRP